MYEKNELAEFKTTGRLEELRMMMYYLQLARFITERKKFLNGNYILQLMRAIFIFNKDSQPAYKYAGNYESGLSYNSNKM